MKLTEKKLKQVIVEVLTEHFPKDMNSTLLEISDFQCNKHSLGWISPEGKFTDVDFVTHGMWMREYQKNVNGIEEYPWGKTPDGWIKVSNAQEF